MQFRSKSNTRIAEEILHLAARYRQVSFEAVDNILDLKYFNSLLPYLIGYRKKGYHFRFFYETRSNLKKEQIRALRSAGVLSVQAGVESLSSPILKLMRKGVTALQNIRTLKWACSAGLDVKWNLLYGVPGEPAAEYERMTGVMQSLTHLQPPSASRMMVERFSPYHESPEAFGIANIKPAPFYRFLYEADAATLNDLAYGFTHQTREELDPLTYCRPLLEFIRTWEEGYLKGINKLTYQRGPGFLIIRDRRSNLETNDYHLGEIEAEIYLLCDAGATPGAIWSSLQESGFVHYSQREVTEFLESLLSARLVYQEGGSYLSLALPDQFEASFETGTDNESQPADSIEAGQGL